VQYGLRDEYVVQVDAVAVGDRVDITTGGIPGTIFQPNSLSVFFRGDGSGNASLYNGTKDTPIQSEFPTFDTGVTGRGQWHNYAVRFDRTDKEIELFVDEVSVGTIDLTQFAGGLYQNFSNAAVGAGAGLGAGENRTWTDNFQVGGTVPEPGALALAAFALPALLRRRPRR
jgi:MYXO-CTERM domain-containing protein